MASPPSHSAALRLLLVEDNAVFRRTIEAHLRRHRPWTIVASVDNGESALATLRAKPVDVVVLDISLPGLTGFEIAEQIQQLPRPVPFVFLTLHDIGAYRQQARALGAAGYVTKDEFVSRLMPLLDLLAAKQVPSTT